MTRERSATRDRPSAVRPIRSRIVKFPPGLLTFRVRMRFCRPAKTYRRSTSVTRSDDLRQIAGCQDGPMTDSSSMSDSFTGQLWHDISGIYAAILAHPFVTGLADGTLPRAAFEFYVAPGRALPAQVRAGAGGRGEPGARIPPRPRCLPGMRPGSSRRSWSCTGRCSPSWASTRRRWPSAGEAPTTLAYTSYLLATTFNGSFAEGVGAVLPCYWIYAEVGKHLLGARLA